MILDSLSKVYISISSNHIVSPTNPTPDQFHDNNKTTIINQCYILHSQTYLAINAALTIREKLIRTPNEIHHVTSPLATMPPTLPPTFFHSQCHGYGDIGQNKDTSNNTPLNTNAHHTNTIQSPFVLSSIFV